MLRSLATAPRFVNLTGRNPITFEEKVVLITGASSGIGAAAARRFARAGARLVLTARSADRLASLGVELGAAAIPADLSDRGSLERLADEAIMLHGRVDILINNAGAGLYTPSFLTEPEQVERLFRLNVLAPVELCRRLLPWIPRGGMVVNVSSIAADAPSPWQALYCSTKAALNAYSDALRAELDGTGIDVMTVRPGYVETPFAAHAIEGKIPPRVAEGRPFAITPERCAEDLFRGVRKRRRDVVTPWQARLLAAAVKIAPRLVYARMSRLSPVGRLLERKAMLKETTE